MLSKPKFGWTTISLGDFIGSASYITDVPIDVMESMIDALNNHKDFIVSFDAEGWCFKIIADDYRSFIIEEKDEPILYVCEKNKLELAKEILDDITTYKEDWYHWTVDEENEKEYKMEICSYLRKLKKSLI